MSDSISQVIDNSLSAFRSTSTFSSLCLASLQLWHPLSPFWSHKYTHTYTHPHTLVYTLTHTHKNNLFLSLSVSLSVNRCACLGEDFYQIKRGLILRWPFSLTFSRAFSLFLSLQPVCGALSLKLNVASPSLGDAKGWGWGGGVWRGGNPKFSIPLRSTPILLTSKLGLHSLIALWIDIRGSQ